MVDQTNNPSTKKYARHIGGRSVNKNPFIVQEQQEPGEPLASVPLVRPELQVWELRELLPEHPSERLRLPEQQERHCYHVLLQPLFSFLHTAWHPA